MLLIHFKVAGHTLKYDSINALRERLSEIAPNLTRYGDVEDANYFKQAQALAQVTASVLKFVCFCAVFAYVQHVDNCLMDIAHQAIS
jgi:hypothetical protein